MNDREKKLLILLGVAVFVIMSLFAFSQYKKGMQRMEATLNKGKQEIRDKKAALKKADENYEDEEWWYQNQPAEGVHGGVRAELATYAERSASRYGVQTKGRPKLLPEDMTEVGRYISAKIEIVANGRDAEIYRWLADLQDPKKFRSITRLKILPQRDEPTRMDCELEVAQWFDPVAEGDEVTAMDSGE